MDHHDSSARQSESDRRDFLKSCGRFAATVPPAMTVMLATSLNSNAIAKSTGAGDTGSGHVDTGNGHVDKGGKKGG
jgi:hypothetical protein